MTGIRLPIRACWHIKRHKEERRPEERGSMTVEAALFLVIFLTAFLTLINFGRLTTTEIVMQHAINNTAMQFSQYGYLLTKTGIAADMNETSQEAENFRSDVDEVASSVIELSDAVGGVASGGITMDDIDRVIDAASGMEGAADITREYFQNPKNILTGLLAAGKEGAESWAATQIVSRMAESQVEQYLELMDEDPDSYLEGLGIVGGLDGLDFGDSTLLANGGKDITIIVRFKVRNQMFPILDFGEREMCLSASTRIW